VHASPKRAELARAGRRRRMLRQRCRRRAGQPGRGGRAGAKGWPSFLRYVGVLKDAGLLELQVDGQVVVTPAGVAAGRVTRGANALWLGAALLPAPLGADVAGAFGLSPAELAGLAAAMAADGPGCRS